MESKNEKIRYSDAELNYVFKPIVEKRLVIAKEYLQNLETMFMNPNGTDDTSPIYKDCMEGGSEGTSKEEISRKIVEQKVLIQKLEASLGRIENKTYGVCVVTGKLIPEERLKAVPHTQHSIEGKNIEQEKSGKVSLKERKSPYINYARTVGFK